MAEFRDLKSGQKAHTTALSFYAATAKFSVGGAVWPDIPNASSGGVNSGQYRRKLRSDLRTAIWHDFCIRHGSASEVEYSVLFPWISIFLDRSCMTRSRRYRGDQTHAHRADARLKADS